MKRFPEKELMDEKEQVEAYASADFEEAHNRFVELFGKTFQTASIPNLILDLGCGPGDITRRIARRYSHCSLHGVDGSQAMIAQALRMTEDEDLKKRIQYFQSRLQDLDLPEAKYSAIISNSLLHHLHRPEYLWQAVRSYAADSALIFIMDLKRPACADDAKDLVDQYASKEPDILQRDFYQSLLAAFTVDEVQAQLHDARMDYLQVRDINDRHITISGLFCS